MTTRGSQGGNASRKCVRAGAYWTIGLLLPLLAACTTLTGTHDVPPPWDSTAASGSAGRTVSPPPARIIQTQPLEAATPTPQRPAIYADPAGAQRPPPPPALAVLSEPTGAAVSRRPSPGLVRLSPSSALEEGAAAYGSPRTVATVPAPVGPSGYVIGVGDTLVITVFGQPDLSATVNVSDDGSVPLALIGKTQLAGLTPAQAADHISAELKRGQYLVNPEVSVTLSQYLSQQVSVLGDVKNPGRFPVAVRLTVLDALALAGGITDLGSQRVYVLRPDASKAGGIVTRYEIDLDALMAAGAGQEYFDVRAGDTLVVPRADVFYIYGEVRLPNAYKLRPDMTVMQALSLGGGLTDKGSNSRLQIRRRGPDGRLVTDSASLTDRVEPNDVIFVRERIF